MGEDRQHHQRNGFEFPDVWEILLKHQFKQTEMLGHLHGKLDQHIQTTHSRFTAIERRASRQRSIPRLVWRAVAPWLPGLVALIGAIAGKVPWWRVLEKLAGGSTG